MQLLKLWRNHEGGVALLWAIVLPVVFGFIALSLSISSWYLTRSELQTAVDSAAVAATYSPLFTTDSLDTIAVLSMGLNGFDNNHSLTGTVNNPPVSGGYGDNTDAVEVIATVPVGHSLGIFSGSGTVVSVRAVGLYGRLVE